MAPDTLRNSTLARALGDLVSDISDLFRKEVRLARAEVTESISAKLRASVWMIVAGVLGLIAALLVVQAIVFAIASLGLALHWSCLVVAAVLALAGVAIFYHGRSLAEKDLLPRRSVKQVTRDIETVKEQLT
jgi:uncharacterized protein YacL